MEFTKINGSAGCGKTFTAAGMITMDILAESKVLVVTPTNKAVSVLKSKLPEGIEIGTLHSMLYEYKKDPLAPEEIQRTPKLDPTTGKFEKDEKGNTIYNEELIPKFVRIPRRFDGIKLYVDESSMVGSDIWCDLINGCMVEQYEVADKWDDPNEVVVHNGVRVIKKPVLVPFVGIKEIIAFGDEKQLEPVETFDKLDKRAQKFYRFWFDMPANQTLTVNHRQKGDLASFIDTATDSLWGTYANGRLPTPLFVGENMSVPISHLLGNSSGLQNIYSAIRTADIIIVATNEFRMVMNTIKRKLIAKEAGVSYIADPIEGDEIIFKTRAKQAPIYGVLEKFTYIAKNTYGKILEVIDYEQRTTGMSCIIELETGEVVGPMVVDYSDAVVKGYDNKHKCYKVPNIDFGYCVTAHSSQGGQWPYVLFFDNNDTFESSKRIRYVAVTRASELVIAITNVSKERKSGQGHIDLLLKNA